MILHFLLFYSFSFIFFLSGFGFLFFIPKHQILCNIFCGNPNIFWGSSHFRHSNCYSLILVSMDVVCHILIYITIQSFSIFLQSHIRKFLQFFWEFPFFSYNLCSLIFCSLFKRGKWKTHPIGTIYSILLKILLNKCIY